MSVACSKIDIKNDKAYSNFLCILAISGQKVAKCKLYAFIFLSLVFLS